LGRLQVSRFSLLEMTFGSTKVCPFERHEPLKIET
jgi:hypothetical protein